MNEKNTNGIQNVFIAGVDPHNLHLLETLPGAGNLRFHDLFRKEDMKQGGSATPFDALLDKADRRLRAFDGTIDAIIGYWDFPSSSLVPILTSRFGLPGSSRDSMLKCEHKYWSRLEQRRVVPEVCPEFRAVDPFEEDVADRIDVPPPYWIKPVKATSSYLSYLVERREDLEKALGELREGIGSMANAFDELLKHAFLPPEVRDVTGHHCLVEKAISGRQCTVSGYVYAHRATVYGIVDSLNYPDTHSFQRYQLPSRLPEEVRDKLIEYSKKIMLRIGYNDAAFNIEFFYDENTGDIGLLEINPRISQSHGHIYEYVDGEPNHKIMLDLAMGNPPEHVPGNGDYPIAAKWFHKKFENAHVDRVPTPVEIREIEERTPGVSIEVVVKEGMDLEDLTLQDIYSFEIAHIHAGAENERELKKKVEGVIDRLPFEFSDPRNS